MVTQQVLGYCVDHMISYSYSGLRISKFTTCNICVDKGTFCEERKQMFHANAWTKKQNYDY